MIRRFLHLFQRPVPWYEQYFVWILIAGCVLAMGISLSIGVLQSVWFDEAYSISLAKRPIGELLYLTSIDTHPPFYYLLLKAWAGIFGWSEVALRSLSVVAMGGAVAVGILLVKRLFGVKAALITLPFVVFAPFLLRYGFEVRMYALASLIGIAATYVLVAATETTERSRQIRLYIAYAALVALGVYTMYYTAVLWIAHVVWLIWLARYRKESVLKQHWWLAFMGSFALFLPWIPTFFSQMTNGALAAISQQVTMENLVGIVSFWSLYQPSWQLNGLTSLVILGVIIAGTIILTRAYKQVSRKQKPYLVLFTCYAVVPIAIITLISLARPMYVERYLAQTLIGLSLLIGIAIYIATLKKSKNTALLGVGLAAVLLLGVANLALVGNFNFQRLQSPQIRELAQSVDCTKDTPIVAADPYVATELSYYVTDCQVFFYSDTPELRGGYGPMAHSSLRIDDPRQQLKDVKSLTYIYYDGPKLTMPERLRQTRQATFGPIHADVFHAE